MGTQFNFSHVTMMHENMCIINVFVYMYRIKQVKILFFMVKGKCER